VRVTVGPVTAEVTSESAARLGVREGELFVASWKATATRLVRV
jgi:molybdopterin-binding protein